MTDLTALMDSLPMGDIARRLGVDQDTADDAVRQVLPGLVGGLAANAEAGGAASLERALGQHHGAITDVDQIDTDDGAAIVGNIFGQSTPAVASKLADASPRSGVTQDLIQKLLPIVAPIVLAWLANRFLGGKDAPAATAGSSNSGGGIGDILGGLLGGGAGAQAGSSTSGSSGGDLLGGILGGLLGGGKR